ncbi:MAG: OB-fold nucleic acid binding domain-containing protein [Planctomycetota bacterium]|nr:OB-fold nucleic acid binding domain-containing protein [Planctomycetota bacterium]
MTITTIQNLAQHVDQTVTLQGGVYNRTSKGKLHFVMMRDGTGFVQCVLFKKDVPEELFEAIAQAGQESSLVLTGMVKADDRAPGGFEIKVTDGKVLQVVEEYPLSPKEHGPDFL